MKGIKITTTEVEVCREKLKWSIAEIYRGLSMDGPLVPFVKIRNALGIKSAYEHELLIAIGDDKNYLWRFKKENRFLFGVVLQRFTGKFKPGDLIKRPPENNSDRIHRFAKVIDGPFTLYGKGPDQYYYNVQDGSLYLTKAENLKDWVLE